MDYEPLYHALQCGKRTRDFLGHFYNSFFSLVFYILGAFLMKQLLY